MYEHKEYPKFIYHKSEEAKIVHSKEEHEAHKGWKEHPSHFEKNEIIEDLEIKKPKKK